MSNLRLRFNRAKSSSVDTRTDSSESVTLDVFNELFDEQEEQKKEEGEEMVTFSKFLQEKLPIVNATMAPENAEKAYLTVKELWSIYQKRKVKDKTASASHVPPICLMPTDTLAASASNDSCFDKASDNAESDVQQTKRARVDETPFGFAPLENWEEYALDAVLSMGTFSKEPILRREKIATIKQYLSVGAGLVQQELGSVLQ